MATEVVVPPIGESITSVTLLSWSKQVGDEVRMGDVLAELETEKATVDVECPAKGVVLNILIEEGQTVPIGTRLAVIGKPGEQWRSSEDGRVPEEAPTAELAVRAAPSARRLARDLGVSIAAVAATVGSRRVIASDVQTYHDELAGRGALAEQGAGEIVRLSKIRVAVAGRMTESATTIPQFSVSISIDATALLAARGRAKAAGAGTSASGKAPSVTAYLVHGVCRALEQNPVLNSRYLGDGRLQTFVSQNIAVAVATDDGLVAPVISDAGQLSVSQIAEQLSELVDRARMKKLSPDDMAGATFTISNLGALGADHFIPMVVPGQTAMLGVGAISRVPAVQEDRTVVSRSQFGVTLSADHRVTDGAGAMDFLNHLRLVVEMGSG